MPPNTWLTTKTVAAPANSGGHTESTTSLSLTAVSSDPTSRSPSASARARVAALRPSDAGRDRVFLSYPAANFEFPEGLYGIYVQLARPLGPRQLEALAAARGATVYVEVLEAPGPAAL